MTADAPRDRSRDGRVGKDGRGGRNRRVAGGASRSDAAWRLVLGPGDGAPGSGGDDAPGVGGDDAPGVRGDDAPGSHVGEGGSAAGPDDASFVAGGALNMAVDDALLASVRRGGTPVLRLYAWRPACLSIGRNQPALGRLDAAALRRRGVSLVRRPTGGRAVLHDRELTYSVVLPVGLLGSPRATYRRINEGLAAGLRRLGVGAEPVRVTSQATRPAGESSVGAEPPGGPEPRCFGSAADGEVAVAGRKLIGSAQRCEGGVILQHGSILLDGSQEPIGALFGIEGEARVESPPDRPGVRYGAVTLREILGTAPPLAVVARAMAGGFAGSLGTRLAPLPLSVREREEARRRLVRYLSHAWTWRR